MFILEFKKTGEFLKLSEVLINVWASVIFVVEVNMVADFTCGHVFVGFVAMEMTCNINHGYISKFKRSLMLTVIEYTTGQNNITNLYIDTKWIFFVVPITVNY